MGLYAYIIFRWLLSDSASLFLDFIKNVIIEVKFQENDTNIKHEYSLVKEVNH